MYKVYPEKRYNITLNFLKEVLPPPKHILDLGVQNPFSKIMSKEGYQVENTTGEDLDEDYNAVINSGAEIVTAFEIFEHLLAPYNILKAIKAKHLIASVPLDLWFAKAYRSKSDQWDRHYHEFEDWQFDWLLEKTGWKIEAHTKFTNPINKIGFRPIFAIFYTKILFGLCKKILRI
jgi:hypothetical protein